MTEGGDAETIVLDNGCGTTKAGFAGYDNPSYVFSSFLIARRRVRQPGIMIGMEQRDDQIDEIAQPKRGVLGSKGDDPHEKLYGWMQMSFEPAIITNWDSREKIWHYAFYNELCVKPEAHPVLLTERPMNPKANRERITQIMFDTFNVPSMRLNIAAVLALYATGRDTGCVLDSGHGVTHIVPIYEGYALPHAVIRMDMGGYDLDEHLMKILAVRGYSLTSPSERVLVPDIKETLCYVAVDFEEEMKTASESSTLEKFFELPNGSMVVVGNERFRCPEILFQPQLTGLEMDGVADYTFQTIMRCDAEIRKDLYANIILSGGSTLFPGFQERLHKEVASLASDARVNVVAPPNRKYLPFVGGSIVASLPDNPNFGWVSKDDYKESGVGIVHRKCWV